MKGRRSCPANTSSTQQSHSSLLQPLRSGSGCCSYAKQPANQPKDGVFFAYFTITAVLLCVADAVALFCEFVLSNLYYDLFGDFIRKVFQTLHLQVNAIRRLSNTANWCSRSNGYKVAIEVPRGLVPGIVYMCGLGSRLPLYCILFKPLQGVFMFVCKVLSLTGWHLRTRSNEVWTTCARTSYQP